MKGIIYVHKSFVGVQRIVTQGIVSALFFAVLSCDTDLKNSDVYTKPFYVFATGKDELYRQGCGYRLFEDTGNPGHAHNKFVWTEKLPKEYQVHLLPVIVTFRYLEEEKCNYPTIHIIKIRKQ
jgi:hypothetical protein